MSDRPLSALGDVDGINPVRIKRHVRGYLCCRRKRMFISPYGVHTTFSTCWNAVVGAVPFVRAIRCMFGALELIHANVFARDVQHCRIARFLQRQRSRAVRNDESAQRHRNAGVIVIGWSGPGVFMVLFIVDTFEEKIVVVAGIRPSRKGTMLVTESGSYKYIVDPRDHAAFRSQALHGM
jgi:hypothetical protein